MRIPRLHLFELADQSWFPSAIRDLVTDYLHFVETRFALHQPTVALVVEALQRSDSTRIVDLCSGGGGSMPSLVHALAAQGVRPQVILTDRFPNTQAFQRVAAASNGQISFPNQPVDARTVPPDMRGLRTMFNAFHHFRPRDAMAVLRDAVQAGSQSAFLKSPTATCAHSCRRFFWCPYSWPSPPLSSDRFAGGVCSGRICCRWCRWLVGGTESCRSCGRIPRRSFKIWPRPWERPRITGEPVECPSYQILGTSRI